MTDSCPPMSPCKSHLGTISSPPPIPNETRMLESNTTMQDLPISNGAVISMTDSINNCPPTSNEKRTHESKVTMQKPSCTISSLPPIPNKTRMLESNTTMQDLPISNEVVISTTDSINSCLPTSNEKRTHESYTI